MDESVATIGFFDGVHRGHQYVIGKVAEEAHRRGLEAVVVTFDRHPREVIREALGPKGRFQSEAGKEGGGGLTLTPLEERRALIMKAGADRCEVLHFDQQLASLSAHDFMDTILQEQLGVKVLMLGYDNRFGHRTRGHREGFNDYVGYGKELGIEVLKLEEWKEERKEERGERRVEEGGYLHISSSAIREALRQGSVDVAAHLLGRPYSLRGQVVHGYGEGHHLGFPTANIVPNDPQQIVPANGVYAVNVSLNNSTDKHFYNSTDKHFYNSTTPCLGMMNIGTRPTFNGQHRTLEVNIFDFDGDLYGQPITIHFLRRIRAEQHFDTPEALRQQLEADRRIIKCNIPKQLNVQTIK